MDTDEKLTSELQYEWQKGLKKLARESNVDSFSLHESLGRFPSFKKELLDFIILNSSTKTKALEVGVGSRSFLLDYFSHSASPDFWQQNHLTLLDWSKAHLLNLDAQIKLEYAAFESLFNLEILEADFLTLLQGVEQCNQKKYDFIFDAHCLHCHLPSTGLREYYWDSVARNLKQGGVFYAQHLCLVRHDNELSQNFLNSSYHFDRDLSELWLRSDDFDSVDLPLRYIPTIMRLEQELVALEKTHGLKLSIFKFHSDITLYNYGPEFPMVSFLLDKIKA